jgi:elongation factor Ts
MNPPYNKAADVPADFVAQGKGNRAGQDVRQGQGQAGRDPREDHRGKIAKIVNEVTLYGQPYVLNTDQTVEAAIKAAGADVVGFQRLAVGEGIEKVVEGLTPPKWPRHAGLT